MEGREHDNEEILDEEEDSLDKKENAATAIVYGDVPISMKCPYCLQQIRSEIIMKPEFISVALGISLFAIVPNFIMILLLIALIQFTASKKHRCPLCDRQLGSDGKFLLYFTDEVMSFSFFSAGFIFTKKMLMTAVFIAFAAFLVTVRASFMQSENTLATTWAQYAGECGKNNPSYCLNKYKNKNFVNWEGYVVRMVDNRESRTTWYLHAISLFMKMNPPLVEDSKPDILLTLNSDAVFYNSDVLKGIMHGDLIKFNCSLHERERGSLKDVMHFHVESFNIEGHDQKYGMFTTEFQQEWIQIHVENKGKLQTEMDEPHNIKPI